MIVDHIQSGVRTVVHLATYFDELKQTALGLRDQVAARQRGYFTPSEDDEVRHLLVSYWQARNALFDLVTSFRDYDSLPADTRSSAFLVAYAGAILLVDAARFLREMYRDSSAIVAKLNEPESHFGIPPGTYDTVQDSLTNPKHAWHLYHAIEFFSQHERELRELAREPLLAQVVAVIDRLGHRLQLSASRFAAAELRIRTELAISSMRRTLMDRALFGLQKIACLLVSGLSTRPSHRPGLPPEIARELSELLQPGDVLVTRKEHVMTNYFLPGFWPHAALFLGDPASLEQLGIHEHPEVRSRWGRLLAVDAEERRCVLEALKDGVWIRSLRSPFGSDAIAALRPQLSASDIAQALTRGMFHEGKSYDFDFDFTRSDRLVCTEVVYRSYEGIGGVKFELSRRAGRLTLAAEDLLRMALDRIVFEPLAVFAPTRSSHLLRGGDADDALRATMGNPAE